MDNLVELLTQPVELGLSHITHIILHRTIDQLNTPDINFLKTRKAFDLKNADNIVCSSYSFQETHANLNDLTVATKFYIIV